jgi:predicted RNase H-like HicB family nuclease
LSSFRTKRKPRASAWSLRFANKQDPREVTIRYPIAIETGTDTAAYGVVVPDLPGCFSAGDTLDEAVTGAEEAAAAWIDAMLDAGEAIPAASSIEALKAKPDFAGWTFGIIAVARRRWNG